MTERSSVIAHGAERCAGLNNMKVIIIASVHGNSPNLAERARWAMTERSDDNAQTSPNVAQGSSEAEHNIIL